MDTYADDARAPFDRLGAGDIEGMVRLMSPGVDWLGMWRRRDDKPAGRRELRRSRSGICPLTVAEARLA